MKRLLFLLILFASPAVADDLPVIWLEAGKKTELNVGEPHEKRWELRYEHRVLASGVIGPKTMLDTPPLKPGIRLQAKLLIDGVPVREAIIASPDPFEDRKTWFAEHSIALYDPEKTTAEIFEKEEMPFKQLRSFTDIVSCENAVIVVGQGVDFEKEKRLTDLLFQKAAQGNSILVAEPKGNMPFASSLPILDVQFLDKLDNKPSGRIIFDKNLRFFDTIESQYYFKSLIETLTPKKGN